MARTALDFPARSDFWSAVEDWAKKAGFRNVGGDDSRKVYQKGRGFLVAPMMLEIRAAAGQVHVEAWVRANFFVRLTTLFIVPPEMGVESAGFKMVIPRRIARNAVNELLEKLGRPTIP